MAAKGRVLYNNTEEALRAVLEGQSNESKLKVSGSSDTESNHSSKPSDHSYTDSAPTVPHNRNATDQAVTPSEPLNGPRRGRRRGQKQGEPRGRGQRVRVAGREDILIAKNRTVSQTTPQNGARCCMQDTIKTPPGITDATKCNSVVETFRFFITPTMVDRIVLETNREAKRKVRQWNGDDLENQRD